MQLADRTPILVEARVGEGKILLASFAATPDWSNLPLKPEFVPLLLRSASYLRRPPLVETPPTVRAGEPAVVRVTDRWPQAQAQATDPAGRPHTVELRRSGRRLVGALLDTDRKGHYRFTVRPGAAADAGVPDAIELGTAVNLDTTRADFTPVSEAEVRSILSPLDVTYVRSSAEDPTLASQLTEKREIWRTLIWVLFAVVLLEFVLATLRPSRPAGEVGAPAPARTLAHSARRWLGRVGWGSGAA
jgi:hypothetical protein